MGGGERQRWPEFFICVIRVGLLTEQVSLPELEEDRNHWFG